MGSEDAETLILIVDDNPEDGELYQRLLGSVHEEAYAFCHAESGGDGLALCQSNPPDCVLLDDNLSDIDGVEFLAELADDAGEVSIPVVMLTDQGNGSVAIEAMKHGARDYLVKDDITPELLHRAVCNAIEKDVLHRRVRESELLARALLNAHSESSILVDKEGVVLACNAAAANRYGMVCEELIGRSAHDLFPSDLTKSRLADTDSVFATGRPVRFKDTRAGRTSDTSVHPVRDTSGKVTACAIFSCDITERKQAEDALKAAKEAADAANRAKSEFLAKMSHELRTPMNSIIGFTEMMINDQNDPPNEKRGRRLEKVHRNAKNLLALINDILDLSKVEADRLTLDSKEEDVAALISECVEMARPLTKDDRVELRQCVDDSLKCGDRWVGDAIRLRQIVTNLLSNACKFTECGCIEVRAQVNHGELVIEIADTGIGIAAESLATIFDEFHQVDSSSTRRAGGTGLGLSICRRLCKLMGGDITVTSTQGAGSCFTVKLPMPKAVRLYTDLSAAKCEQEPVLYVGSKAATRQVKHALEVQGSMRHAVSRFEFAQNAKRAMELWQQHHPAMVWIDPFLEDALRFLADLKTRCRGTDAPVGFLGITDDLWKSTEFDNCLALPLGKDTFHRVVCGVCDSSQYRILLLPESMTHNGFVRDFLAEFTDLETVEARSVHKALDIVANEHIDAALIGLTHPRAMGLELVEKLRQNPDGTKIRRIAVIPREPTSEDNTAFQAAFRSHIAGHGESLNSLTKSLTATAIRTTEAGCPMAATT